MARVTKVKDHEILTDANIAKVIELLNASPPITKKAACEILNISYNTARLGNIIESWQNQQIYAKKRRAELRTKPVSTEDIKYIISEYLDGVAVQEISERTFRSVSALKKVLEKYKVPLREVGSSYFNPVVLPDDGFSPEYEVGDLVFSARYNVPARIEAFRTKDKTHGNVYQIYLLGNEKQKAYQPAYELGDLRFLEEDLGIRLAK
jgi:hypothetical protein